LLSKSVQVLYSEILELTGCLFPIDFYVSDRRHSRTLMTPANELRYPVTPSFGNDLNTTIRQIPHPTGQVGCLCYISRMSSEENTLHSTRYEQMYAELFFHDIIHSVDISSNIHIKTEAAIVRHPLTHTAPES